MLAIIKEKLVYLEFICLRINQIISNYFEGKKVVDLCNYSKSFIETRILE